MTMPLDSFTQATKTCFLVPKRITVTIPASLFRDLVERSQGEGRSLSNLASFLLERSLELNP